MNLEKFSKKRRVDRGKQGEKMKEGSLLKTYLLKIQNLKETDNEHTHRSALE